MGRSTGIAADLWLRLGGNVLTQCLAACLAGTLTREPARHVRRGTREACRGLESRTGGYHARHYIWGLDRLQALPLACAALYSMGLGQAFPSPSDKHRNTRCCARTQPHCSVNDEAAKRLALRPKTPAHAHGCWTLPHGAHRASVRHRPGVTRCSGQALGKSPVAATHQGANRRGDQPIRCTSSGQSKPGPGSCFRPGATCSWPTTSRTG